MSQQAGSNCEQHAPHNEEDSARSDQSLHICSQQEAGNASGTKTRAARKPRQETTWPTDLITVVEVNEEGTPLDKRTLVRLRRVCGFTAWQNVNLNLANFDDLSKDARGKLFDNNIQTYVAFPKDLRDTAIKLTMKMISSAWRTYKYRLPDTQSTDESAQNSERC